MVEFDWDEHNIRHLWERHRVTIDQAEAAFRDPRRVARQAVPHPLEKRRAGLGVTEEGRLLHMAWVYVGDRVRVFSARDATDRERRVYRRRGK